MRKLRQGLRDGTLVLERERERIELQKSLIHAFIRDEQRKLFEAEKHVEEAMQQSLTAGMAAGKSQLMTLAFKRKQGLLGGTRLDHLIITIGENGRIIEVKGDISDIQKFEIPPNIKVALAAALLGTAEDLVKTAGTEGRVSQYDL